MELYVHIPYCVKKCNYCDFLSFPVGSADGDCTEYKKISRYVDALCKEIEGYAAKYRGRTIDSVFIGGGTPSVLAPDLMRRILQSIGQWNLSPNAEFSIECNPGTVTEEKFTLYKEYGVNRLSFGLQSVNDSELKELGRIHTYEDFIKSYNMARRAGFDNINIDLISAIPGQSVASWEKTLRTAAELNPEHISAYSLIVEEGTPFFELYGDEAGDREGITPLPDEDSEREIYALTDKVLSEYGFHRYEISNYATDGRECRHNLGYWTGEEYLGFGLGASSYVDGMRYKNTDDINLYTADSCNMTDDRLHEETEVLTDDDLIAEYIILRLRLVRGFDMSEFAERFGTDIHEMYGDVIAKYTGLKLLEEADGYLRLTPKGFDVSNTVMAEFI